MNIIICDIDGVLANEERRRKCFLEEPAKKQYDDYYKNCLWDTPFRWLTTLFGNEYVIFITGRRRSIELETRQFIQEHFPNIKSPFSSGEHVIYMREDGNNEKAIELKNKAIEDIMRVFNPILAIDDNPDICKMYNDKGIPTITPNFYVGPR